MLFNSFSFLVFFPVVVLVLFIIPRRFRSVWLLIASYWFYMSWNPKYAVLIGICRADRSVYRHHVLQRDHD